MRNILKSSISTPTENWAHVYMNLFTRNSPFYLLLKYLLFLLKHPVYKMCIVGEFKHKNVALNEKKQSNTWAGLQNFLNYIQMYIAYSVHYG